MEHLRKSGGSGDRPIGGAVGGILFHQPGKGFALDIPAGYGSQKLGVRRQNGASVYIEQETDFLQRSRGSLNSFATRRKFPLRLIRNRPLRAIDHEYFH